MAESASVPLIVGVFAHRYELSAGVWVVVCVGRVSDAQVVSVCAGWAAWTLAVGVAGEDVVAEGVAVGGVISALVGGAASLLVGLCAAWAASGTLGELVASGAGVGWTGRHVR